ncbi:Glycosyl transferase family 2 [Propionibacterium ruminifibrarum]|uniref:Glycosyl transferase family 2 n=1 Tax=Propionibacterium ruminifibrarum TaxID=1962131 RepID=A0A375I306_9ACTN|nr:glycosyltransferase [Propionibacterium ruminifibrarum]SPF68069.1 Glycosyl transferase family 2 [Propionibacterium ruminifibrarum]
MAAADALPGEIDEAGSRIVQWDRSTGRLRVVSDFGQATTLVLVRDGARTVGAVTIATGQDIATAPEVRALPPAADRAWKEGAGAGLSASVVLCTTGDCDLLHPAVEALLAQTHPDFELVVVDNAPASGRVRRVLGDVEDARMRIIEQPARGLSHARNAGAAAASRPFIAFTDDDAIVDPGWLVALLDPFAADPDRVIGATTGMVLPAELRYRAQRWFESRGGFPKDDVPRVWMACRPAPRPVRDFGAPGEGGPLYPVTTARVGAGVCMAYRAEALAGAGSFDVALGAGTPTRGGEDLDMFARVLRAGWAIVHTPDAVLHHRHRRDEAGLDTQVRGNGSGTAALLTKSVLEHPSTLLTLAGRLPAVAARVRPGSDRVAGTDDDTPGSLTRSEIKGFLEGPVLYARSAWSARRAR